MLDRVLRIAANLGYRTVVGEFIPSMKNHIAKLFFEDHCFEPLARPSKRGLDTIESVSKMIAQSKVLGSALYARETGKINLPFLEAYENG